MLGKNPFFLSSFSGSVSEIRGHSKPCPSQMTWPRIPCRHDMVRHQIFSHFLHDYFLSPTWTHIKYRYISMHSLYRPMYPSLYLSVALHLPFPSAFQFPCFVVRYVGTSWGKNIRTWILRPLTPPNPLCEVHTVSSLALTSIAACRCCTLSLKRIIWGGVTTINYDP